MINTLKNRHIFSAIAIIVLGITIGGCCQKKKCPEREIKTVNVEQPITEAFKPSADPKLIEEDLCQNVSGFNIADTERQLVTKKGGSPVYGEIKYDSLQTILNDLNVKPTDVFYDLGSGVGKVTIQAYLNFPFKKSVGIELSPTRHINAVKVREKLAKKGLIDPKRVLEFYQDDIAEFNINDATIIYMCSTCYPTELMTKLAEKFSKLKPGLVVITLKSISNYEDYGLTLLKEYSLPMTWSEGSPVHVYKLEKSGKKALPKTDKDKEREKIKAQITEKRKQIYKLEKEINALEEKLFELGK